MTKLLHSEIPFYKFSDADLTIANVFCTQLAKATAANISVGYASADSLEEFDRLIHQSDSQLTSLNLVLGMYLQDGMPESIYRMAKKLNSQWQAEGLGQIWIPKGIRSHEKVFLFYDKNPDSQDNKLMSVIIGSSNLSFLVPDARTRTQKETALFLDSEELEDEPALEEELEYQMMQILKNSVSFEDADIRVIREENQALKGVENVNRRTRSETELYLQQGLDPVFKIELKVPQDKDKCDPTKKNFMGSNVNVCYAKPRNTPSTGHAKHRGWYEMQLHVDSKTRKTPGYPTQGEQFFIVTDDGYWFKAHTESQGNKQLSAVGNEKIMGYWLKGRLAAAGLVKPVDEPRVNDPERKSAITKEMLASYGTDYLLFGKTSVKALDENGKALDVWYLSFDPKEVNSVELSK